MYQKNFKNFDKLFWNCRFNKFVSWHSPSNFHGVLEFIDFGMLTAYFLNILIDVEINRILFIFAIYYLNKGLILG